MAAQANAPKCACFGLSLRIPSLLRAVVWAPNGVATGTSCWSFKIYWRISNRGGVHRKVNGCHRVPNRRASHPRHRQATLTLVSASAMGEAALGPSAMGSGLFQEPDYR